VKTRIIRAEELKIGIARGRRRKAKERKTEKTL
jgi:hypothetical protein